MSHLLNIYHEYLECLNRQAWNELANFVCDQVCYNSKNIGLSGYQFIKAFGVDPFCFITTQLQS